LGTFLITSKASDARRQGATTEAYGPIRRKEERTPALLGREGNAADHVLMVDKGGTTGWCSLGVQGIRARVERHVNQKKARKWNLPIAINVSSRAWEDFVDFDSFLTIQ